MKQNTDDISKSWEIIKKDLLLVLSDRASNDLKWVIGSMAIPTIAFMLVIIGLIFQTNNRLHHFSKKTNQALKTISNRINYIKQPEIKKRKLHLEPVQEEVLNQNQLSKVA